MIRAALLLLALALVAYLVRPRRAPVAPSVRRPNVSCWNDGAERRAYPPESEDGVPPFDPEVWDRAQRYQSVTVIAPSVTSEPWTVAACGFAHPWGICHGGHEIAWQR